MSNTYTNRSGKLVYIPALNKNKSGLNMTQQARASKQRLDTKKKSQHENSRISRNISFNEKFPVLPRKKSIPDNDVIVVPAPITSSINPKQSRCFCNNRNQNCNRNLCNPKPDYFFETKTVVSQSRPVGTESRIMMINKACHMIPQLQDAAQYTNSCSKEMYQALLIEQYGFNPTEVVPSDLLRPVEKSYITCQHPKVENSSQCENPATTNTGTNGTAIDMGFEDHSNSFGPKNIEISETPRLKVIAEKFTRFKRDRIELRQLEERVICVEYDVFNRDDTEKKPIQIMRAYFSVKTGCDECKGALLNNVYIHYNLPMGDENIQKHLETEVEVIDEKLSENKPYLKDLQSVLKKRQAMNVKKQKSTLDLMSMYTMAYNETPPREHDWSHTNLLSKAELEEVKHLILKKCESRVHNLSRKKINVKDDIAMASTNTTTTDKRESLCYDLLRDFDNRI